MKNADCHCAISFITGCAQQTFTVQNKPAAVAPKETITHHFFVSELKVKKTVTHNGGGAEKIRINRNPATFRTLSTESI